MTISRSILLAMAGIALVGSGESFFPEPEPPKTKPRPRDVNYLCDECEFLSPTEKKQTNKKEPHMCIMYNERVYHFGQHPKIFRCDKCLEVCNDCVGRKVVSNAT